MKNNDLARLNSGSKVVDYFTGYQQTRNSRNKGCTAGDITSLSAFVLSPGGADAMGTAADGHIFQRSYGLLV